MSKAQLDKFAELMLYVAKVCADDPKFGATKLNKILFFSDFLAYRKWGKSITGATYQRLDHGPAPKCLLPVQQHLRRDRSLAIQEIDRYGLKQKRPVALRDPNLDAFDADEIALVNEVVKALHDANAADASELSHGFWWHIAKAGEEIPIQVSLVELPDDVSLKELAHARSLEAKASQLVSAS
jgi:hypothetical protein